MKEEKIFRKILKAIYRYTVFFMLIAFVITCCVVLFIGKMSESMNITFTEENLHSAAKLTFLNVMFLSLVCTVIDTVRRRITVGKTVKKITNAAEKIISGDFSVRILKERSFDDEYGFNGIIDCFNKMAEELSGTQTLRTDFIANVSHEIKTPLSVIKNYGKMLQNKEISDEKRQEYAEAITKASERLANLISNILKLNKLENQQIFPKKETYNLSEQLCVCLLDFEEVLEEKQIKIETDIDEAILISGDCDLLSMLWSNLFSNAVKFTPKNGKISVNLHRDEEYAVVKIADTGCGISKEVGAHMFDKFYQGDTSHSHEGNGLGLALVKRVAYITGSDIAVESKVGEGSVFTVKVRRG